MRTFIVPSILAFLGAFSFTPALAAPPAQRVTDPALVTRAYVESFGDVREWLDLTTAGSDERRCIFNSLQRMNTMRNYFLAGATPTNISFLRKDMEALMFNLTAQQPPVGSEKNKVRGFWISIRCADAVRSSPTWKTVMVWTPIFEAMTRRLEADLGYTFAHVEVTPQGGNMLWWHDKAGKLVILR